MRRPRPSHRAVRTRQDGLVSNWLVLTHFLVFPTAKLVVT
jgi:hypothetical protein